MNAVNRVVSWLGRQATAGLPVDPSRRGSCNGCGLCCQLVTRCPHLRDDNTCDDYENRPLTCRAYPRTKAEQVIPYPTCGYYFEEENYMSPYPSMGGYFRPVDPRDRARKAREEFEGLWSWNPSMEGFAEELKEIEEKGSPGGVAMDGNVYYEPAPFPDVVAYGQMTWNPMISESYPGMWWNPRTGKMETQKEIMSKLKWPRMGGIPYQYNPPRPRGFLGIQYPLNAPQPQITPWNAMLFLGLVGGLILLGIGSWYLKRKQEARRFHWATRILGLKE